MNKKTGLLIVVLLVIASFLAGSTTARIKYHDGASLPTPTPLAQGNPIPPFEPQKTDKPEVKFFVMSFCPYGNQAEAGLEPVYQLLKDKVSWQPRYIVNDKKTSCEQNCAYQVYDESRCQQLVEAQRVTDMETCKGYFPYKSNDECLGKECSKLKAGEFVSLHGDQELRQNIREICALAQAQLGSSVNTMDKWWKFVSLVNDKCSYDNADTCWTSQAKEAGLNTSQITSCVQNQTKELLEKEIAESEKYQAQGSPTFYINDVLYQEGRAPEDLKKAICSSFNNPPEECSQILGQETAPTNGGCN